MTMCTYYDTIRLIIILWTSICLQDAQAIRKSYQVVERCPFNESEWKVRAAHTTCNGSESYHCLMTEGGVLPREQCTKTSLFTSGFCPIFTNEGYLQWSPCKDTACPTSSYRSDEVYEYQICYRKTDKPKGESTEQGSNDSNSVNGVTIIVVAILLFSVLVLVLVLVVFYIRNQFGFKDKAHQRITDLRQGFSCTDRSDQQSHITDLEAEVSCHAVPLLIENPYREKMDETGKTDETYQKTEKLNELLNYLVHILKVELGVNDLKEKAVIHSKSINEHFTEPLIIDLQSIKDHNDYTLLDTSLVFALLRNFCDGIKPPSRGWDYEPPDDETHVGADIERIRSMWNRYCDNDLQFKHLDDVYSRMKRKYGTVAIHGDDGVRKPPLKDEEKAEGFELMKDKILSIKLNPDCIEKKGIVITESVTTSLKILKSRNVVVLTGVIGCGKTHALKAIQNHFQEKNWETEWVESENVEREISQEEPRILLCDNFFGKFGCSVFSQDAVDKTENALKKIERSNSKTKVVIGIHTHVYDEVKKKLVLNFLNKKNITVEMDNLSDAERLLIFKEQQKRGHCKKDSNCWFKCVRFQAVLDKLSKNQGHIGGPFLSLMYCNQHELFSDETFSVDPVQTLMQYIGRMKQASRTHYDCLVYLMCIQQHTIEEEPEIWAGYISVNITKHNLMELLETSGLLQFENKRVILAHELLTIALFKYTAERIRSSLPVLEMCNSDVFLQLSRPLDSYGTHMDLYYEYIYDISSKISKEVGKMCAYRLACIYTRQETTHPLMMIKIVKDNYLQYLHHEPKDIHLHKEVRSLGFG